MKKICPKCGDEHEKSGKFCSRSCANSRGPRTQEFKDAVSKKLRTTFNECVVCGKMTSGRRKTCSAECLSVIHKNTRPPITPGGYRHGSGRGKHGWYKGFYLDSTYELAYVIYCLDHNIEIKRNKKYYEYNDKDGKRKKYYPDFIVDGNLVEIKGYYTYNLNEKLAAVDEPIQVMFADDLKHVFEYVENKTGLAVKELHALYEVS